MVSINNSNDPIKKINSDLLDFLETKKPTEKNNISIFESNSQQELSESYDVNNESDMYSDVFNFSQEPLIALEGSESKYTNITEIPQKESEINPDIEETTEEKIDEIAIHQLEKIASNFTNRTDLSEEEYGQILALNQILTNYQTIENQYKDQNETEGIADQLYNNLKNITGLGITKEMINNEFTKEKNLTNCLISAINKDTQNIEEIENKEFINRINNFDNFNDKFNTFLDYYGNEDEAINEFNRFIEKNKYIAESYGSDLYEDIRLAKKDNEIVLQIKYDESYITDEEKENLTEDGYTTYKKEKDKFSIPLPIESIFINSKIDPESDKEMLKPATDFNSVYKFMTGVEFSPENIQKYLNESYMYSQANSNMATAYQLENSLTQKTPETAFEIFKQINQGNEDTAIESFNSYYQTLLEEGDPNVNLSIVGNKLTSIKAQKNENGQIEFIFKFESEKPDDKISLYNFSSYKGENDSFEFKYNITEYNKMMENANTANSAEANAYSDDLYKINMLFCEMNNNVAKNGILEKRAEEDFKNRFHKTIEESIKDYNQAFNEAFGENELQNSINKYISDMDSYSQRLSSIISIGSIGASFINPLAGIGAIFGAFSDNIVDGINMATNEKKNEDWQGLIEESIKEASFMALGVCVGKIAATGNNQITNFLTNNTEYGAKTISQIGTLTEATIDAALGMGVDYITTGDINLTGNGLSVFMDILSGARGYRALKQISSEDIELKLRRKHLANMGVDESYIKDITKLNQTQYEKCVSLIAEEHFDPYYSRQLAQLDDIQYKRARELMEKGMPLSRAADAAVLTDSTSIKLIDDLMENPQISNYYVTKLSSLDPNSYEIAYNLITKENYSAPSAIDITESSKISGLDADSFKLAYEIAQDKTIILNETDTSTIENPRTFEEATEGKLTGYSASAETIKEAAGEIRDKSKKMKKEITPEVEKILEEQAAQLYNGSLEHVFEAEIEAGTLTLLSDDILTARAKGIKSTLNKLITKYEKGSINLESKETIAASCKKAIGDSYGTRIQISSLDPKTAMSTMENTIKGLGLEGKLTPEEFIESLVTDKIPTNIDDYKTVQLTILNALKEKQTEPIVRKLIAGIEDGTITITELNNYGNNISCYFSEMQIYHISEAYYRKTGEKLDVTSKADDYKYSITFDETKKLYETDYSKINSDKAVKESGYTSSQMNVKHKFGEETGNGELQIRGKEVNAFGDVEHIPYDIRQGKITAKDTEYSEIYSLIKNMSNESYELYNQYLTATYDYLRLKELGIEVPKPEFKDTIKTKNGNIIPEDKKSLLTMEGLIEINKKAHGK